MTRVEFEKRYISDMVNGNVNMFSNYGENPDSSLRNFSLRADDKCMRCNRTRGFHVQGQCRIGNRNKVIRGYYFTSDDVSFQIAKAITIDIWKNKINLED